jgi:hypothetical protein
MSDLLNYQFYLDELRKSCIDYPAVVSIETFVQCNAACRFCPYPQLTRKGERMPDTLFEKIIKDLCDIPETHKFDVNLSRINEPFLDSRIFLFASRINEVLPQASLVFFSNGSTLSSQIIAKLQRLNSISRLNISLNDHRPQVYQEVMQLPFDRTYCALHLLHDAELPFPVILSRVGDGSGEDVAFTEWVKVTFPKFKAVVSFRSDWLGLTTSYRQPIPDVGCSQWFKLHLLANGRDAFCCIDAEGRWGAGDVRNNHALDIYNTSIRRARREVKISRTKYGQLCGSCPLLS